MKWLLILCIVSFTCCRSNAQTGILPASRAADMIFTYHYDGGMVYYSEDLILTKDSCIYEKNDNGKKTRKRFKLSATEMDELYTVFLFNKLNKISSKEEQVYDRGGISIDISWDKYRKRVKVSDAQMSFVNVQWRKEWNVICDYLRSMITHL